ncbi:MAG: DNA-formamidopyrimidine glycosylase family protein [Planctomycetaceae bacterium]
MPELPEVETMVRGIRPHAEGRTILDVEFCRCPRRPIEIIPRRAAFRSRVRGATIRRVFRLAKRAVLELDADISIVIEPRMTGLLLVSDPPTTQHRRVCWHLRPKSGLRNSFEFWDRRGLGTVRLLDTQQMDHLRSRLGPDAMQIEPADWKRQLAGTSRHIKVALLDQSLVAGIGNLYASEILHMAGISPFKRSNLLPPNALRRLADATQAVLSDAILHEGSTLSDGTYRNALNKDGGYQNYHRVYDREGQVCSCCERGIIRRAVQAQRSTFYCPICQRTPRKT